MGFRLTATRRRAKLRQGARCRRLADIIKCFLSFVRVVRGRSDGYGAFVNRFLGGEPELSKRHCGDLVPIPPLDATLVGNNRLCDSAFVDSITELANFSMAGINYLYGGSRSIAIPRRATAVQRMAQLRFARKWWDLLRNASRSNDFMEGFGSPLSFDGCVTDAADAKLIAANVDGLSKSGRVDPSSCLPPEMQEMFSNPSTLFPNGVKDIPQVIRYTGGERVEYAALVVAQLRSQKTGLSRRPTCSANVFVVSKNGTTGLREVWDGSSISAASDTPDHPRWLADPAALVALEASCDSPIYLSTRGGKCFFDQLRLDDALVTYCGRPQVQVAELCAAGFDLSEIKLALVDADAQSICATDWLSPVSLTWPMGFAHSAYVAQQLMTASCLAAGYKPSQFITSAGALPQPYEPCIAVATDDVNSFTRLSRHERAGVTTPPLQRLDKVWEDWKVESKDEKSVDLARSGVLLGVEIVKGLNLMPKSKRMGVLLSSLLALLAGAMGSPKGVHSFLGKLQWTSLLNRPLLSALGCVYGFVERAPYTRVQSVPSAVLDELCLCLSLICCLNVDLARPWAPDVVASDGAGLWVWHGASVV